MTPFRVLSPPPSHSGAVLPLRLFLSGLGARKLDISPTTNLTLKNWLVQCHEHLCDVKEGVGRKVVLNLAWVLVWEVGRTERRITWRSKKTVDKVLQRAEPPLASQRGLPGSQKGKQEMARPCRHHLPTSRIPHLNGTWCIKSRHARPRVPVCLIAPHQRVSRASLPRGRDHRTPLSFETARFDWRQPGMCSEACGGRESG